MSAIHPTYIVSFPRSGQHLVIRGLMWVMPDLIVYSENYQVLHHIKNNGAVNVQKDHDFDLNLPVLPEFRYLVLMRDFVPALKSWYRLQVESGMEDSEASFRSFCIGKLEYYEGFRDKWRKAAETNPTQVRTLDFLRLCLDPAVCLREIRDWIVNGIPVYLKADNSREVAFETFELACRHWRSGPNPPFPYEFVIDELFPGTLK